MDERERRERMERVMEQKSMVAIFDKETGQQVDWFKDFPDAAKRRADSAIAGKNLRYKITTMTD